MVAQPHNERSLPWSIESEMGVLGSILIDPQALDQVIDILVPDDFYRESHRIIYRAMLRLSSEGLPADVITLSDTLEREQSLDDVGDISYIISLVNQVPTSGNIAYYARIVERDAICRRVIHAAGLIAALAYERSDDVLNRAEQIIFQLRQKSSTHAGFVSMQEMMSEYLAAVDTIRENPGTLMGVPTGYHDIDVVTGGLQKADLIILAARPSMGKSALAMSIAHNAACKGKASAIFSIEMGRRSLAIRYLTREARKDAMYLRNGWIHDDDWDDIVSATGRLSELPIWVNDACGSPISMMRSQLRRLTAEHTIDLIIVDYLQLVDAEEGEDKANRTKIVDDISKGLKQIAREFDVPVLALAQLSRAVESRQSKVPMLSDLRESGGIEQNADLVFFIYRDAYYAKADQQETTAPNIADIILAKHRNGPIGNFKLYFKAEETAFYDVEVTLGE